ncbi:MAG TPA: hypothetical protein PLT09_13995 [Deltaproteobacteria bacterium]|nr:hypothetical protein [Deltaproteobacteria bacterium]HPR56627.1 hypothetical protein [Deltaproteobacteria bacterium]HXK48554.1 hypothetical protein [Deltaproteobacteria bacterium]
MRSRSAIKNYIVLIRDLVGDVEDLLDESIEQDSSLQWKDRATDILGRILGKDHTYVREFHGIEFSTPFFDDFDELLEEETFRIGLEDARSFLISLIDELESEHNCTPGLMDMESLFAEMNRYVVAHVGDAMARSSLHNRIMRLRNGMMSGEISGDEVRYHMEHIGYLDTGLYKRMVPLLTWYYIQGAGFKGAHNN